MVQALSAGSWTELLVGIGSIGVAAVLGLLALKQGKEAERWVEKSVELQRQANVLAEAALPVRFKVRMHHEIYHDGDEPGFPFGAWLELEGAEGSAAVFVHRVETAGAYFDLDGSKLNLRDFMVKKEIEPAMDESMPTYLLAGNKIYFRNPWMSYSPEMGPDAWAKVRIFFSVTQEVPPRDLEVDVWLVKGAT